MSQKSFGSQACCHHCTQITQLAPVVLLGFHPALPDLEWLAFCHCLHTIWVECSLSSLICVARSSQICIGQKDSQKLILIGRGLYITLYPEKNENFLSHQYFQIWTNKCGVKKIEIVMRNLLLSLHFYLFNSWFFFLLFLKILIEQNNGIQCNI